MMHFRWSCVAGMLALGAALFGAWPGATAAAELSEQQQQQRQVQAEAEALVRRIETMVRVLEYNRLEKSSEKQLLDEVGKTLTGLTREQMTALIAALKRAGKASGPGRDGELTRAQRQHEEIVLGLKDVLARFDAVRDLDVAAEKLDALARDVADHSLAANQLQSECDTRSGSWKPPLAQVARVQRLASEQAFLKKDFTTLLDQVGKLDPQLLGDARARADGVRKRAVEGRVAAAFDLVPPLMGRMGRHDQRAAASAKISAALWSLSERLVVAARSLRATPDRGDALRQVSQRLEKAINDQEAVRTLTLDPTKIEGGDLNRDVPVDRINPRNPRNGFRPAGLTPQTVETVDQARGRLLGDRQGRLEHEARVSRLELSAHAPELSARLEPAEKAMRDAQMALREVKKADTVTPRQDDALRRLREVKKELDRLLAEEERKGSDPLDNLRDSLARVERLVKQEKAARAETEKAVKERQTERLPEQAAKQADLARDADAVKEQATAARPEAKEALDRAARSMEQAADAQRSRQAPETTARQNEAVKELEAAREAIKAQIKETEGRRDEVAKLEEAAKNLDGLIKKEEEIAAGAKAEKASPKEAGELAKKQEGLTQPTRDLGKEVKASAPKAGDKLDEGARAMEAAKADLDKAETKAAARKADDAAGKLKEAKKAIDKALAEKKAEEAAANAGAEPNSVDPMTAAQQLAKALEEAEGAARAAAEAAEKTPGEPSAAEPKSAKAQPDLRALQKAVADRTEKVEAPQAKAPAEKAARALEKGDVAAALEAQTDALAKLQEAAAKSGKGGKEGEKEGAQAKKEGAQAKNGKGDGEAGEGTPSPAAAKNAGELARAQEALREATARLAKSQAATQAAAAALGQAQAQAPQGVQGQLSEAAKQLAEATASLEQGQPAAAGQAQTRAAGQLASALDALNKSLAEGKGAGTGEKPGGKDDGKGMGKGQAPGKGTQPGKGTAKGKGKKPGKGNEKAATVGSGDRIPDGQANNDRARDGTARGDGRQINLPPRQRELLQQAMSDRLPPEYSALIQQYFINIARGKPALSPAPPRK